MSNFIALTGFVANEPQVKGNAGRFSLHFYDTKRDNNPVYSYISVKVYDFSSLPKKGDLVNVVGSFHKYSWNDKECTEIWCNYDGWSKVERRPPKEKQANSKDAADNQSEELPPDDIYF